MKGVFFKNPLEFQLDVKGDQWRQGDEVAGTVSVRNRGSGAQTLEGLYVHIAAGTVKKVREKAGDAFTTVAAALPAPSAMLASEEQLSFPWAFRLDVNCMISDKGQSLYLLCGKENGREQAGQLALTVMPHAHIDALLSLLESSFSFVLKVQKSKKDWVEAKLKAPSGKQYPTLEHLMLSARFEGGELVLRYQFNLKTLQASATTLEVKKAKRDFEQRLRPEDYVFPNGPINNQPLEAALDEALSLVRGKM